MKLFPPFIITSRLMAGVQVGGATISIGYLRRDERGRCEYDIWFDLPGGVEYNDRTLGSAANGGNLQQGMRALLSFLGVCVDSRRYQTRTGRKSESADMFPDFVGEWAEGCSDEIDYLQAEVEADGEKLIIEE